MPERKELEPWLAALDAQIAAEDRADRRAHAERRRHGLREPDPRLVCGEDFLDRAVRWSVQGMDS